MWLLSRVTETQGRIVYVCVWESEWISERDELWKKVGHCCGLKMADFNKTYLISQNGNGLVCAPDCVMISYGSSVVLFVQMSSVIWSFDLSLAWSYPKHAHASCPHACTALTYTLLFSLFLWPCSRNLFPFYPSSSNILKISLGDKNLFYS